jgi:heterodisulfide reductase subunit C
LAHRRNEGERVSDTEPRVQTNVHRAGQRDREIIVALKKHGFEVNSCMQCGTCTSSCPSGRWTALSIRRIMRRAAMGDATVLADPDIWLCTTCYNCFDRCPRNLKVTDAVIELRNLAAKRGFIHKNHRKVVDILHKTGHAVPINSEIKELRKKLSLPEVPPTLAMYPEDTEKMAKVLFQLVEEEESK